MSSPKPPCVHCKTRTTCRPRGLCNYCFSSKAVRALYPKTDVSTNVMTDEEILALPPQEGDQPAPKPEHPNARPFWGRHGGHPEVQNTIGRHIKNWLSVNAKVTLTPETLPEAIAADQRETIGRFLARFPRAKLEEISAAVILPIWTVERRLKEIAHAKKLALHRRRRHGKRRLAVSSCR